LRTSGVCVPFNDLVQHCLRCRGPVPPPLKLRERAKDVRDVNNDMRMVDETKSTQMGHSTG